ncbi:MAG: TetR/AcrR family transcriptional regulator [Ignavibacteriae bacterium]|nr:TetR/AcrR family transcriptional regulator [Ignavibacteriota bacterium]MCB9214385.1 TetR/AcrR family transcriptional regulator [Ignavibacteria bacterium]
MTTEAKESVAENGKKRSLRERQKDLTRDTIIEALSQILVEEGIHGFSVQSVADRAGVSHRTVYRHFPNREALLEGLGEKIEDLSALSNSLQLPRTISDFEQGIAEAFQLLEDHEEMMTAFLQVSITTNFRPKQTRARDSATLEIVRDLAPALPPQEQKEAAALIRFLASSLSWMIFKTQFGLSGEEASRTVREALKMIHKNLVRRNRAVEKAAKS